MPMHVLVAMLCVLAATTAAALDVPLAASASSSTPGPGAVSVPGSISVCLGLLCL